MNVVVDASVVLQWFLDQSDPKSAERRLLAAWVMGQLYVHAPEFMQLEICNSLIRRHKATAEQALKAIQELVHNQITFYPIGDMVQEVVYSTQGYELSSYDALYLALAQHLQIPLVTNDAKLLGVKVHCITPTQALNKLGYG